MTPLEAATDANWPVAHARLLARARLPDESPDNRKFEVGERVFSLKEGALRNKERAQFWSRSAKTIRAIDDDVRTDSGIALSDGANAYRPDMLRRADGVSSLRLPSPPPRARARAPAAASSGAAAATSDAAPPRSSTRTRGRPRPDYATAASTILYQ
jgi:hypothetical protein